MKNEIKFKSMTLKMSDHASERISQRFDSIKIEEAIGRGHMMTEANRTKFGSAMASKFNNMKNRYPYAKLIVNTYYNVAFPFDTRTNEVITALYADGTWSEL